MKATKVEVGQLWKRKTGEYLVVKMIHDGQVSFHGGYTSILTGGKGSTENLSHMSLAFDDRKDLCIYELVDEIPYLPGMKFQWDGKGEAQTIYQIEEVGGEPIIRWEKPSSWDSLPLDERYSRVSDNKTSESEKKEDDLYPPADTKPAVGQIWKESWNASGYAIWLLEPNNRIKMLELKGTHSVKVGESMTYCWSNLSLHWKCLSPATDKYRVGQVWVDHSLDKPIVLQIVEITEGGRARYQ